MQEVFDVDVSHDNVDVFCGIETYFRLDVLFCAACLFSFHVQANSAEFSSGIYSTIQAMMLTEDFYRSRAAWFSCRAIGY